MTSWWDPCRYLFYA